MRVLEGNKERDKVRSGKSLVVQSTRVLKSAAGYKYVPVLFMDKAVGVKPLVHA